MANFTSVSQDCINLIKSFEGFRPKMYICPAGIPTIGFGTAIDTQEELYLRTATITETEASELVKKDLKDTVKAVNKFVTSNIVQSQFDALVDFAYNCGVGNLQRSTLLKLVNQNPTNALIENELMKWNKANGKVLAGLTRRRKAEANLYFKNGLKQF